MKTKPKTWRILAEHVQGSKIHPQCPYDSGYMRSGLMRLYVMRSIFWFNVVVCDV